MDHHAAGRGLLLGAATGAGLGLLTVLALLAPSGSAYGLPDSLGVLVIYGSAAVIVGAAVGVLDAAITVVILLLVRPLIGPGVQAARLVTSVGAAIPALVVARLYAAPWWLAVAVALVCAIGAAGWTRRVLGVPR